ncbi:MAG TPA: magnesium chelatase subunit D, partial [Longimicrobium sp.]|nr:magnesium chelatase subunit D [Longimicrobium sp.]
MSTAAAPPSAWSLPRLAAALLAVDPRGLGGVAVRAPAGPARDAWLGELAALLPPHAPVRRVPPGTAGERLAGGLDLAATLAAGRPVAERGILSAADGGVVIVPSAERMEAAMSGHLLAALDEGECVVERDGISLRAAARIAVVALDEGEPDEGGVPLALADRLALHLSLPPSPRGWDDEPGFAPTDVARARDRLASAVVTEEIAAAACRLAASFGIDSLRAPLFAVRAARALAALAGEAEATADHLAAAAALVLLPRAIVLPEMEPEPEGEDEPPPPPDAADQAEGESTSSDRLDDIVLQAAAALLPPDVLAALRSGAAARAAGRSDGRARSSTHGRRIAARAGDPRRARMDVLATVRAAAPWQRLRGRCGARLRVRAGDFRVQVRERKTGTTVIFVVDASGSSAAHRLAEAKGAVELLLAESYARRDRVALIAFRRAEAELVLPPTRSLARARRLLAGLPGGGATPLATAADAALALAGTVRRGGSAPVLVFLTDARANVARCGATGRPAAEADALHAARRIRADGVSTLVIDTSPRPSPLAAAFAAQAGGRVLPLPFADARAVGSAVRGLAIGAKAAA